MMIITLFTWIVQFTLYVSVASKVDEDYSGPWRTALDEYGSCWTEGVSVNIEIVMLY